MLTKEDSSLLKFLTVHNAYSPNIIPNENKISFLSKKSGIAQAWMLDRDTAEIKQISNAPERVLAIYHSPTGKDTIIAMDHDGNEKRQLYLLKDNGELEDLAVSLDHFHYFGGWSPDGTKIAFSSNRRHPAFFDVYITDVASKTETKILEKDDSFKPLGWTPDGDHIIITSQNRNTVNELFILNIHTSTINKLGDPENLARYQFRDVISTSYKCPELTQDGKGGYLLTDVNGETLAVHHFRLDEPTSLTKIFANEKWDIEEITLSPNEKLLACSINEGGISSLVIYNLETNTHQKVSDVPNGVIDSISWASDSELIFCLKGATSPGDIWSATLDEEVTSKRITFLSEYKELEKEWIEPELHSFKSFDGREIPYFFYSNKTSTSQPVVVYVHGGPEHQSRSEYNPVIQYLYSQGFAVAAPNVRGSMGYGRTYLKLDDRRKRMDAVNDLAWLVKDMVANHGVDPERIGIMGRSYGGFMVLAAITHHPDLWRAAVDIVGISHFKTFLENTGVWRRKLREFEYGFLDEDSDFMEEIAPFNHTDKIKAPLLIFHGRHDTRVPVSEAEQLAQNMKEQGKEVELVIFENEGHQTEKLENHIKMNSMIVNFMQKELK